MSDNLTTTFNGTLTHADSKKHIEHHFDVPTGATYLHITFEHAPQRASGADYNNQVSLSLFDPNGSRGARHNNPDQTIRLSHAEASPGYLPGDLPAGRWNVVIDTHRILPPDPLTYTINVTVSTGTVDASGAVPYTRGTIAPRGAGWYRGDLHGHTFHSDGNWDVPAFFQHALERELDFVTLTDHNTVSALAQLDSLRSDDLLTMGGMELTTYYGHALALGTREWQEWRTSDQRTMTDIAQAIMDKGALFVIAHPRSPGDPACTGCRWEFGEMMPGIAPAVEIWNGGWRDYNEQSLQLYYEWLNQGHRLVATAGSDIHGKSHEGARGAAADVVYAEALSEAAIVDAIRRGHLYLSSGPDLQLTAQVDGDDALSMMGDRIPTTTASHARVHATWQGAAPDDLVCLIVNGIVRDEAPAHVDGRETWTIDLSADRWVLVEVRTADGVMRAITNPIYAPTNVTAAEFCS